MSRPLALSAYRAVTALLEPIAPALLRGRAAEGKEDLPRIGERLAQLNLPLERTQVRAPGLFSTAGLTHASTVNAVSGLRAAL